MTDTTRVDNPTCRFQSEDSRVQTQYVPTSELTKWTLENTAMRKWTETHLDGRVLNACAGESRLNHDGEVVRNDLDPDVDADLHVDAAELAAYFDPESFDTIFYDPPWSHYQSNLRYDGRHVVKDEIDIDMASLPIIIEGGRDKQQLGHARLIKDGFDYLLKPRGKVIQITQHGTCMPGRLGYQRKERVMFDPLGEAKCVIGAVDQKAQTTLQSYTSG